MTTQQWQDSQGEPEYTFSGMRCLYCKQPVPDGYECGEPKCVEANEHARNRMGVGWMDELGID